ncbi:alpha/beta hydrolase [Amycolatopsis rhizosphaerae]|uniref:Alpha/beta hydrolase n=1 Tax=Amycolatopsis rhizosphaerae TaxID=2053003 RepID=A0A558DIT3_9PSEU|nr:alpha/beta hydrolase [Amycolatopsis rhizosphaerae]TVT60921.1 alpha/beta hydrolase [Amycolatopsis rhizosphaerae]
MSEVTLHSGLIYHEIDGTTLRADLHLPKTELPPPVVVYVHGGGFQFGARTDDAETRLSALAAHGVAVLSIDYRPAPVVRFPAPVEDVRQAVRWVRAHAADLDVDSRRVALWGASAGATLAALAALSPGEDAPVGAVVAWFGMADLAETASRSRLEARILPFDFEAAFLGDLGRAREASPLTWVNPAAPPFLIAHGDRDRVTPVNQSHALHDALVRAGAESTLLLLGGAGHEDRAFESPAHLALTAGWLSSTLGAR